jgi:uncharacterized protein (TIGR03086 family)
MTDPVPPTVDPLQAFVLADRALERVVQQVRDDQWELVLPDDFARMAAKDERVTLRQVIGYHAYDEAWMPDMLAGRTMDEVGRDRYDGDLLGDDPRAAFAALVDRAVAAARSVDDLDRVVHWSYGDFPLREGIWHPISFRGLRTVDLARVLGLDDTLDPVLVRAMWEEFLPQAETWRAMGVFGPRVEVADDAPLQERLLGLTGRQPRA